MMQMNVDAVNTKQKILVIEDEIENQKYLELILKQKFSVDFCDDKSSMLDFLAKTKYEAIIMDISLKGNSSGIELIKELKKKSVYKTIPIICLSAHTFGQDKLMAQQAGADVYLTKPVGRKTLLNTLEKLIATDVSQNKA
jgi:DNA-binding response OmpR family regulator